MKLSITQKANLCDYNHSYILVKDNIYDCKKYCSLTGFRNCVPFTKSNTKIDGTTIDDAENLNLVMSMYSLLKYTSSYSDNKR